MRIVRRICGYLLKTWREIDGYIEVQWISLVFFLSILGLVLTILSQVFVSLIYVFLPREWISLNEFFSQVIFLSLVGIGIFRILGEIRKKGLAGFLYWTYLRNFKRIYLNIYLVNFTIACIFFYILYLSWDILSTFGMFVVSMLLYHVYNQLLVNSLGKILLHKKTVALYQNKNFEAKIYDKTFQDTFYLIENLKESYLASFEDKIKAENLKIELITNISHDIKTPLTSIINYLDLLKNERDPGKQKRYLETLDYNAQRLRAMVVDLVYASKTETGNIDLDCQVIEVNELINQVYGQFDESFTDRGLDFIYESNLDPLYLITDGAQLSRIVENLFSNIEKYSQKQTRVYVQTKVLEDFLLIDMKNISSGPLNIDPDNLMEQFVRGERSRYSEGSGLGLYIVKNLVHLLGGQFFIDINGDMFTATICFHIRIDEKE